MTTAEFILLICWLSGVGIGLVIGAYQSAQLVYDDRDRDEGARQALWIIGSICWPIVAYFCFLQALHQMFKKIQEKQRKQRGY